MGNIYYVGVDVDYTNNLGKFDKKLDLSLRFNDANAVMVSVKNAYLEDKLNAKSEIVFGRKPLDWSFVDTHWGFGNVNNRENFDFFTPGVEGLTGITYKRSLSDNSECSLFGSVIYIPELNPGMRINSEEGTIEAVSPWSTPPNSTVELGGIDYNIKYDVDMSGLPGTIFKPSVGANCTYRINKHVSVNAFVINKPEGKINTGAEVSTKDGFVQIGVSPQAFYQTVSGGSVDYTNAKMKAYVSVLTTSPEDYPDGDAIVTNWTEIATEKYSESYFGTGISKDWDFLSLGLHYVARISEYSKTDNMLAVDPRWNQAVNFYAKYSFTENLSAMTDLKYDALTHDRLMMFGGQYLWRQKHRFSAGVNIIASADAENDIDTVESFWSRFRNNDAIYAKYGYLF